MRILFSTDQIYLHGGIEKVMAEKANYFADLLGYEVYILTTEQKHKKPCYLLSEKITLVDLAINYVRVKSYFHPTNLKKIPSHFSRYHKTIKQIQPDFIISCNYAFDFYWLPFTFKKIPKFKEFHSSRYYQFHQKSTFYTTLKNSVNDYIESKFTRLILLNSDEQKYYRTPNTIVIENPVKRNVSRLAKLENKRAIAAGRIAPIKGFDVMIQVWKKVVEQAPEWHLYIFGQGDSSYVDYLNSLVTLNSLQNNVFICSATQELNKELLASSLYIMTSKSECFPMVLIESLSCGLPIVSFDCPTGPRHIISNKQDGFLCEDQNLNEIAEKIVFLISNETERKKMGEQAFLNSKRLEPEFVMPKWVTLFNTYKLNTERL